MKRWEDSELSGQPTTDKPHLLSPKKKLAPLNDAGPAHLLKLQIDQLREENEELRARLKGRHLSIYINPDNFLTSALVENFFQSYKITQENT